ncbi:hypothetical protein DL96DRAFT_1671193 [Flagelloscypha sp. PMI_526]|nr:hypothetical protein DL96DRAFT_1671193 [Flagelloscypha sp. PMI_526]
MLFSATFSALLLSLLTSTTLAAVYQSANDLKDLDYDYVIVGGGAAGCVVASRLSENSAVKVLLIEAGPSNEGIEDLAIPYQNGVVQYPGSRFDWNLTTVPQKGLNGHSLPYLRGHALGGSTSTNGMVYSHGYAGEYDKFAASCPICARYDYFQNVIESSNEAFQVPSGVNITGKFDPNAHGFTGAIGTEIHSNNAWLFQPILDAAAQTGGTFTYNQDYNSGSMLGLSWQQTAIKAGQRSSAASAYINKQSHDRKNLDVLVNTLVNRVVANSTQPRPMITAVEFSGGKNGEFSIHNIPSLLTIDLGTMQVHARKEVIVSTGTMNTPPLLMRSGLGPEDQLKAAGIQTVLAIPHVGQNLIDHIMIGLPYQVNTTETDDEITRNATLRQILLDQWRKDHTGRYAEVSDSHIKFSRIPEGESIFDTVADPTASNEGPHYEQLINNNWVFNDPLPETGYFMTMLHFLSSPISHGSVRLNPSDPNGMALIDPGYLNEEFDVFVLRTALRESIQYMRAPAWQKFNATPHFDVSFIRNHVGGGVHCVGTARMVSHDSTDGVVGPDFKVKGVNGLRIVDASVIPYIPSGHTMAVVYALAERASDVIKAL